MANRDPERLRKYLEMIARREGGIEGLLAKLPVDGDAEESVLESAAAPAARRKAKDVLESVDLGRDIEPERVPDLEAIIFADIRPAIDVVDGTFVSTHPLWRQLSDDAAIKARIEATLPLIGRIELPGHPRIPYGGTGFVVGNGLVMTNRHVAEIFADGLGDRRLAFKAGVKAGLDLRREFERPQSTVLNVRKVVMIHPYWDMAILAVDGLPANASLKLSLTDARTLEGREIFIVGYPAFDPRNPAGVQQGLFSGHYGIKRLQPGLLQGGFDTSSFSKMVHAAAHDISTLGGNSGSPSIDLASGEVLGLHFGGRYQERNFAVPASELSRDNRVIDAGVVFAGNAPGGATEWSGWWLRADGSEAPAAASGGGLPPQGTAAATTPSPGPGGSPGGSIVSTLGGGVTIEVPLRITISLGHPAAAAVATVTASAEALTEAMAEPFHDADYATRTGYVAGFLNDPDQQLTPLSVPMPTPSDAAVVGKTLTGGDVLHYQNFSVVMQGKRRLALFTASNVTKEPKLKQPEPGRDYTRRGLSGLGEHDQERWYVDPRLDEKLQIPDVFFTKDRKAFDKGHIVRRDDVAWGRTYDELRRANGDTYHVTNCSPQVAGFNRSANGEDNWGDLENHVLSEAANERLCVFAGPVLDPADEVFFGVGDGGVKLRAKIPSRFWKLIVSRVDDGLAAYGFLLEQDLGDVDFEFAVPPEFTPAMRHIAELQKLAGVTFADDIIAADQFETVRGAEMALRNDIRRK